MDVMGDWFAPRRIVRILPIAAFAVALLGGMSAHASVVAAPDAAQSPSRPSGATSAGTFSTATSILPAEPGQQLVHTILSEGTSLFTGVTFTRLQFDIPGAGQLDVVLKDMEFPAGPVGGLTFALVDGGSVLGLISGGGALSYVVDGPKTLYAYIFGVADPSTNVGSYYLSVTHDGLAPVPLPGALVLLLSGLAAGRRFVRRAASSDDARSLTAV